MKVRSLVAGAAALALALVFTIARAGDTSPEDRWKAGNKFYEEKTYKKALENYLEVRKLAPDFAERDDLNLKIAICELKLKDWVQAEEALKIAVKSGDRFRLQALILMGQMYRDWPHELYFKGDEQKRGEWIDGGQYRWTAQEDQENTGRCFDEAKKVSYELRELYAAALAEKPKDAAEIEKKDLEVRKLTCDLNFNLVLHSMGTIQNRAEARWKDPVADAKKYDPAWTPNEKIVFLYDEVTRLEPDEEKRKLSATALRDKGLYYLRRPWWFERKPEDTVLADTVKAWREAIDKHPKSGIADEIQYMIARATEDASQFVDALAEFRKVLEYKDSKWVSDAKWRIQEIERPRLGLGNASNWTTAQQPEIPMSTRNVKSVALAVHEFNLAQAWDRYVERMDHGFQGGDFASFAAGDAAGELKGEEIATWTYDAEDDGRHGGRSTVVKPKIKKAGTYLLTAEANGIVTRVVVVVSDMVIVERLGGAHAIYFAADAETGKAIEGVDIRVLERITHWDNGKNRFEDHKFSKKTGADGLAAVELAARSNGASVMALASHAGQHAILPGTWWYAQRDEARGARVDAFTDRPVYRPNQKVQFKATARIDTGTGYRIPDGGKAKVVVTDPKGNKIFDQSLQVSEFGSVHGEIQLAEEPPLGQYSITVQSGQASGYHYFRVEEYKKPEMLVEVVAKTEQAKLGDGLTAEIHANYYFGGGVADADVTYTVTRKNYNFWWRESDEFDWYYGNRWGGPGRDWGGEVVANGKGKTDENGVLLVEWSTQKAKTEMPDQDHEYVVHAQVTDSSRRTIEGEGSVRVTRTQMFATLTAKRGFYVKGGAVEIEINTQNANNQPLASEGNVTVARVVWDASIQPNGNWKDEPVLAEPAKTDAKGRGYYKWQSDRDGVYAFTYETRDAWGEKVTGRTQVTVADPSARDTDARLSTIDLTPEERTYRPGETARILLWSDVAGATVMVTTEAQTKMMTREVKVLDGKSYVLEIPLKDIHVPNFFVRAVTIRGGQVFQAFTEIFVPPADKFLQVTATPSKGEYKPGESARYDIMVKDWQGKPARTEIGLTVFDKSILYIAPQSVADIRLLFWGARRYSSIGLQSSRNYGTGAWMKDSNTFPEYKLHGDPFGLRGGVRQRRGETHSSNDPGMAWDGEDSAKAGSTGFAEGGESDELALKESKDGFSGGRKLEESMRKAPAAPQGDAKGDDKPNAAGSIAAPPVVRKNFADTAYWTPWVVTGEDGKATIEFTMPDSLTTWHLMGRAIDGSTRVGSVTNEVVTRKTLMARLQAPRFFREKDELLLSAILNNEGKTEETVKTTIKLDGGTLELLDMAEVEVKVPAGGEFRVDWKVKAVKEGAARIVLTAIGKEDSDAMQLDFPVYVHGMDTLHGWSGVVRGDEETTTVTFDVPADRKISTTDLTIQVQPTLMGAILDSLPYLLEYPYGCVEQTMSRFLPAVAVADTLKTSGISLEEVGRRRKLAYADLPPSKDPVFHTQALQHIVEQGLGRLAGFQNGAGGWGWWQGGEVDPFITAYVVNGLRIAKASGAPVNENVFQRGVAALKGSLTKEEDLHRAIYCAYVLAECKALDKKKLLFLYEKREDMNSYGRALLAMALQLEGEKDKAEVAIRNMEDFVKTDEKAGLSWWAREDKWSWWTWYGDDVEGNAAILRAYCRVDPKNPNAPRLAKWLLTNREGMRWKSTRDTAHAVLALVEYAKIAGELSPEYTAEIAIDGKVIKTIKVTADNVFTLDGEALMRGDAVETGKHTLTVKKTGKGTAYWSVFLGYFSKEDHIPAAESRLTLARTFYKLNPKVVETNDRGRKVRRIEYEREKLADGATVTSGDLMEIEMTIEAPNDYEYLVFEDFKAAGCEPTEVTSGPVWGTIVSNREFRDERVASFVSSLRRGKHTISYRVRAEIPGNFRAMPATGYAMYAPSVKANSEEFRLVIVDKPKENAK